MIVREFNILSRDLPIGDRLRGALPSNDRSRSSDIEGRRRYRRLGGEM